MKLQKFRRFRGDQRQPKKLYSISFLTTRLKLYFIWTWTDNRVMFEREVIESRDRMRITWVDNIEATPCGDGYRSRTVVFDGKSLVEMFCTFFIFARLVFHFHKYIGEQLSSPVEMILSSTTRCLGTIDKLYSVAGWRNPVHRVGGPPGGGSSRRRPIGPFRPRTWQFPI